MLESAVFWNAVALLLLGGILGIWGRKALRDAFASRIDAIGNRITQASQAVEESQRALVDAEKALEDATEEGKRIRILANEEARQIEQRAAQVGDHRRQAKAHMLDERIRRDNVMAFDHLHAEAVDALHTQVLEHITQALQQPDTKTRAWNHALQRLEQASVQSMSFNHRNALETPYGSATPAHGSATPAA